jgi:hypothetical protein
MPRPRKSLDALKLSGTFQKTKGRYSGRREIDNRDLGEPPKWLSPAARSAWREMVPTLPWLRQSHRGIVAITSLLAAKMRTGELGMSGMNLLRQCLGSLGANPSDFARIGWSPPEEDDDDGLGDEFFR